MAEIPQWAVDEAIFLIGAFTMAMIVVIVVTKIVNSQRVTGIYQARMAEIEWSERQRVYYMRDIPHDKVWGKELVTDIEAGKHPLVKAPPQDPVEYAKELLKETDVKGKDKKAEAEA